MTVKIEKELSHTLVPAACPRCKNVMSIEARSVKLAIRVGMMCPYCGKSFLVAAAVAEFDKRYQARN